MKTVHLNGYTKRLKIIEIGEKRVWKTKIQIIQI